MTNLKILELLNGNTTPAGVVANLSSTTNSILGAAVTHHENTSESRIGVQVHKGSTKPDAGGLPHFKNLQKSGGGSILAER